MSNLDEPTEIETRMVQLLRSRIEEAIRKNGRKWAAAQLQISEPGVDAMLWKPDWSIGKAVHVAGLLDVLTNADLDKLEEPQVRV